MVSFRVFQGSMGRGKEDIISGAIKLSEYRNRELTVAVELNSYTANSSEQLWWFFSGGGTKDCSVFLRRGVLLLLLLWRLLIKSEKLYNYAKGGEKYNFSLSQMAWTLEHDMANMEYGRFPRTGSSV